MALITCHECGHQISDQAISCPSCGAPVNEVQPVKAKTGSKNVGCVTVFVAIFIVIYVAFQFMPENTPSRTSTDLGVLDPIKSFIVEHPEFGKPRSTSDVPDWRFGQRQRVVFDSGRDLLFYIRDGKVITVYEDSPTAGRQRVWGEPFEFETESESQ